MQARKCCKYEANADPVKRLSYCKAILNFFKNNPSYSCFHCRAHIIHIPRNWTIWRSVWLPDALTTFFALNKKGADFSAPAFLFAL